MLLQRLEGGGIGRGTALLIDCPPSGAEAGEREVRDYDERNDREQELHDQDCVKVGRLRFLIRLESEPVEAVNQPAPPAATEPEEEAVKEPPPARLVRPELAAEMLGISEPTVRSHLQRMFSKTDTPRQADLMRLLQNSTPPIRKAHPTSS